MHRAISVQVSPLSAEWKRDKVQLRASLQKRMLGSIS